jgi:lysozyme
VTLFVDLSNNNAGEPNWRELKRHVDGVMLKVSEGATFADRTFKPRRDRARAAGLRVGGYHFARPSMSDAPTRDAVLEARHFSSLVLELGRRDYVPALDMESLSSLSRDVQVMWARAFSQEIRRRLGRYPLFYSYPAFITGLLPDDAKPIGGGLWLAAYGRNDGKPYPFRVPKPWKKAVAHQFTSQGRVAGVTGLVDVSRVLQPAAMLAHPLTGRL